MLLADMCEHVSLLREVIEEQHWFYLTHFQQIRNNFQMSKFVGELSAAAEETFGSEAFNFGARGGLL
jgi:hypothetical protein